MKKKTFLKLPEFPGGKEEFKKYILANLVYPRQALDKKIQGIVYLSADINDDGDVMNVRVEKGLGYGCDEEAVRLISSVQFGGVNNHGLRVKTRKRFRIEFKIKEQKVRTQNRADSTAQYHYKTDEKEKPSPKPAGQQVFTYSVPLRGSQTKDKTQNND
jgi:TonB family protein